jgi:hypothetical protein
MFPREFYLYLIVCFTESQSVLNHTMLDRQTG